MQALVHATTTGNFVVSLSSVDLGQRMKSVIAQICAGTLGAPTDRVINDAADSNTGPHTAWGGSPPISGLVQRGKIHALVALGGTQGTTLSTAVMRVSPRGLCFSWSRPTSRSSTFRLFAQAA
jgi:CO/xanthine dehydrogenase Mo-binding subunit